MRNDEADREADDDDDDGPVRSSTQFALDARARRRATEKVYTNKKKTHIVLI